MTHLPITPKQALILYLLYRFRFLDRTQIQHLLNHKNHKTIQLWLNDLLDKHYIARNYSRRFPDNTKPAVYYLAKNGIKWLRSQDDINTELLRKYNREHLKSQPFIEKCLLLASIYLGLSKRTDTKDSHAMYVASDYPTLSVTSVLADIVPDAFLVREKDSETQLYLLEVLSDWPLARLRQRLKQYLAFYASNEWEAATGQPFPTILLLCPDGQTLRYCAKYIRKALAEFDQSTLHFRLTTHAEVKESGLISKIWEDIGR